DGRSVRCRGCPVDVMGIGFAKGGRAVTNPTELKRADLVLSGGGVKGIGLVGAVVALMDAGYSAQRGSGTRAGSAVGADVAAGAAGGAIVAAASEGEQMTGAEVKELALSLEYRKFLDPGAIERVPLVGPSLALLRGNGVYRGDYARDWVASQLNSLGVNTFGD